MRKATLTRQETADTGTFGMMTTDSGFQVYCGELPDRNNEPGKSCIPEGVYVCRWAKSPKHGECYYVTDVPKRTDIEIHSGNWCGDTSKGLKSDVEGCIILGNALDEIGGQKCLIGSRDATSRFADDLEKQDFQLTVLWQK